MKKDQSHRAVEGTPKKARTYHLTEAGLELTEKDEAEAPAKAKPKAAKPKK